MSSVHHTLPAIFCEFCKTFIPLLDSSVSFVTNLIPSRTYPYLTEHNISTLDRILWSENVVRKILYWGRFPEKHFATLLMGENLLGKSSEIFRFGKCCLISGNVGLRFYDFASLENVREMRRNHEPYRCASALLQAASRILTRNEFYFLETALQQ